MATLRLSNSGMQEFLASAQMEAGVLVHAEQLKAAVEAVSPVASPSESSHPGRYQRSWHLDVGRWRLVSPQYGPHPIVQVTVYNDSPEALKLEFGTQYMNAQHVLQKTVDAVAAAS